MKAMILAAGRGERMRPLTDTVPKPLLLVGNKPLIVWHIERLATAGITEIVINHAWLGDKIEALLGCGADFGVNIMYSRERPGGLETAGGIRTALPLLGEEPFLVVSADIFTDFPFESLQTLDEGRLAHLVMVDNPPYHPLGDWGISAGLADSSVDTYFTFGNIGLYHPLLFSAIQPQERAKLGPLLRTEINASCISAEYYRGVWCNVGTVEDLTEANKII